MGEFCIHSHIVDNCCQNCGEEFEKKHLPRSSTTQKVKKTRSYNTPNSDKGSGVAEIYDLQLSAPLTTRIIEIYQKLNPLDRVVPPKIRTHFAVYQGHKELGTPIPAFAVAKLLKMGGKICSKHYRLCYFIYYSSLSSPSEELKTDITPTSFFHYYIKEMNLGTEILGEWNSLAVQYSGVRDYTQKPQHVAAALICLWAKNKGVVLNTDRLQEASGLTLTALVNLERDIRKGKIVV